MLNSGEIAKWDQDKMVLVETIPPLLFGLCKGFIETGFSKEQAFDLTKTYLTGMMLSMKG